MKTGSMNLTLCFVVFCLLSASGCATMFGPPEPYQVEQRNFKEALSAGQYGQAKAKLSEALNLVPGEKKPDLQNYFSKAMFRQSSVEYKLQNWDTSFDLMATAYQGASADLRRSWAKECHDIQSQYVAYHLQRANDAVKVKDLKTAIAEYEIASKPHDPSVAEARSSFDKYTAQRRELEAKLEAAKAQIEKEQWASGMATLDDVLSQDASLGTVCRELSNLLTERHYQAAIRDCRASLAKKELTAAFSKANEALALNTSHPEAAELKSQVQKSFAAGVAAQLKDALAKDDRPSLENLAKQYAAFELDADASHIRTVLANRAEADRNWALAQEHIAADRHESAIEPLCKACALWPENQKLGQLQKDTRIHVAKDALSDGGKADDSKCPLVCALYCMKARTVCPTEADVQDAAKALAGKAIGKVDRKAMETAFIVAVKADRDIEATLDTTRLIEAIIKALPPASRFVAIVPAGDKQPEAQTVLTVQVDVSALFVATREQAFNKSVRYVSDVAYDPNPAYIQLQADLGAAQAKMAAAQQDYQQAQAMQQQAIRNAQMAGAGAPGLLKGLNALGAGMGTVGMQAAQDKVAAANSEYSAIANNMSNTSATIPRNIYSDYPYVVHQYDRRGTLKATVRMVGQGGKPVAEKVITDTFQQSDTAHDGYAPAGLQEDTLDLPSEEQVRDRFLKKLFTEAASSSSDAVATYWKKLTDAATGTKDTCARWEKLLTLSLQVPAMKDDVLGDIRRNVMYIPKDFVEQLDNQFENAGR
jgi:hypothetical protein